MKAYVFLHTILFITMVAHAEKYHILYEYYVFDHPSYTTQLSDSQKRELKRAMDRIQKNSVISQVEIASWADDLENNSEKQASDLHTMIDLRNSIIKERISQLATHPFPVLTYNMNQRLEGFFTNRMSDLDPEETNMDELNQLDSSQQDLRRLHINYRIIMQNRKPSRTVVLLTLKKFTSFSSSGSYAFKDHLYEL
jgi:mRNA-degrading endonuclease RelE of RelBE toxin-antitoxin system